MTSLQKAVLATIIYYDTLGFPLTSREAGRYLISPRRVSPWLKEDEPATLENVLESLAELRVEGKIEERLGFYFLPGRGHLYQERMEQNKLAETKWKKARRYLYWVQLLPFIEGVLVSGSLALGHTSEESDLDILVVAKEGRIWTARLLIILLYSLAGVCRRHGETTAPDKICPNHFLSTGALHIPFPSLYNAQTYLHLVPVYIRWKELIRDFWEANQWVNSFVNFKYKDLGLRVVSSSNPGQTGLEGYPLGDYQQRAVRYSWFLSVIRNFLEFILELTFLGNGLEQLAKRLQVRRINQNLPGRVMVDDHQLEFHPFSVEFAILQKFNQALADYGDFGDYVEFDSGLK